MALPFEGEVSVGGHGLVERVVHGESHVPSEFRDAHREITRGLFGDVERKKKRRFQWQVAGEPPPR